MKYGMNYYTYISQELPKIIEDMFNVSSGREDRFIGGNSMGGYGAFKIAIKNADKYSAAFGLSSVADIHNKNFTDVLYPIFGGKIPDTDDIFTLASAHRNDEIKPRLYMTVGKDDFMYDDNIFLKKHFEQLNYKYKFVETEGDHSWTLWDKTVQDALKWIFK